MWITVVLSRTSVSGAKLIFLMVCACVVLRAMVGTKVYRRSVSY